MSKFPDWRLAKNFKIHNIANKKIPYSRKN